MKKVADKFSSVASGSSIKGENNDCVVRAFALALERPYDEVHAVCAKHGRRFAEGTYPMTQRSVAQEYDMEEIDFSALASLTPTGWKPTLVQFMTHFKKGRYYVARRGHAFVVIDGVVHDNVRKTGPRSRICRGFKVKD